MRKVDGGAVEMVSQKGATRATGVPAWSEHEVIDDELAAAAEQIGERLLAGGRIAILKEPGGAGVGWMTPAKS